PERRSRLDSSRSRAGRRGEYVSGLPAEAQGGQAMKCLGWVLLLAASAFAQDIHVLPVQGNIYMLVGAGGNIAASIGPDGILLVDSGTSQMSPKVLSTVLQLVSAVAASPSPNR